MCIAIAISLLMILICAMATYGAYKVSSFEISWASSSASAMSNLCSYIKGIRCNHSRFSVRTFGSLDLGTIMQY